MTSLTDLIDLTNRMRTCAAHLASEGIGASGQAIDDATALLIEAACVLEAPPLPLGEPMQILEVAPKPAAPATAPTAPSPDGAYWIADGLLPVPNAAPSRNACPKCDSRAWKVIHTTGLAIWLVCPACDHAWQRG